MKKVRGIITSSIEIAVIAGIIFSLILFFGSDTLSIRVFHENKLISVLKILSIALPFFVLTNIFTSIARGFNDVKPNVYFQNILRNNLFILLIMIVVWFDLSFLEVICAFSLSIIISCVLLAVYVIKKNFSFAKKEESLYFSSKKELFLFSFPLMVSGILYSLMSWTDTLMLAYYKTSEDIGLYNAASPLARLIPIFLGSARYLYIPVVSQLYAQETIKEMRRIYQIVTKWVVLLTLPLFSVMFLFPKATIIFFFSSKYTASVLSFQILAFGFMFHTLLGLNGESLIVLGENKFIMMSNMVSAIFNVALNIILIPIYGLEGAAISTTISYIVANSLKSLKLYKKAKIHPFIWNYVKLIITSLLLLGILKALKPETLNIWIFVLFLVVYSSLVLLSRSIDKEDVSIILAIEKKLGINFKVIKKILEKFI